MIPSILNIIIGSLIGLICGLALAAAVDVTITGGTVLLFAIVALLGSLTGQFLMSRVSA